VHIQVIIIVLLQCLQHIKMRGKNLKRRKDLGSRVLNKKHVVGIGTVYKLIINFLHLDS